MLGAVMFGHRHFQPVIKAIIDLAEKAAKDPWDVKIVDESALDKEMRLIGRTCAPPTRSGQAGPLRRGRQGQGKGDGALLPGRAEPEVRQAASPACSRRSKAKIVRGTSSRPASASTAAIPRRCAASSPKSASCRARTARRCSPAAKPRRCRHHARHRRGRADHRRAVGRPTRSTSCCTTTSLPTRSVKSAASAAPGAAKSATASSPGARSTRCCRRRTNSRTRSAWSPTSPNRTARRRWPRCAALRWR